MNGIYQTNNDEAWEKYIALKKSRPELFVQNPYLKIEADYETVKRYEKESGRKIGVVYESPYSIMVVDLVHSEPGRYFAYERLVPAVSHGAVVIVPVYKDKFVLLNQFRHALRDFQYAFPRGFGEKALDSFRNAIKETEEEIGAEPHDVNLIGQIVADSGINGNKVDVYSCKVENIRIKEKYEGIKSFRLLSDDEMKQWIKERKINDGYTLASYALYSGQH